MKERVEQEKAAVELRATPGFNKDLRELRSCLTSLKKARVALYSLCREERKTFIAETRPFVETILELQKASVKKIRAKEEFKTLRRAQNKARSKLRLLEQNYPRFTRRNSFLRMFRMPSQFQFSAWRLKRFFKTSPRLF